MEQAGARFDGKHFFNPVPTEVMQFRAMLEGIAAVFKTASRARNT